MNLGDRTSLCTAQFEGNVENGSLAVLCPKGRKAKMMAKHRTIWYSSALGLYGDTRQLG